MSLTLGMMHPSGELVGTGRNGWIQESEDNKAGPYNLRFRTQSFLVMGLLQAQWDADRTGLYICPGTSES